MVKVKKLEWSDGGEWDGEECSSDTAVGFYFVTASFETKGKLRLVLNYPAYAQMYQAVLVDGVTHKQARQVAQADFDRRILAAIEADPS